MAGKYEAYPEYKDSGVQWIGMIPKQWDVKKAKHLFRLETGGTPSTSDDENFDENGIPWVKPDNLNEFIPVTYTQRHVSKSGIIGIPIIPRGSILVCGIGTVGKFGIAGADLITNQQINAFIPDPEFIDQKFAKYLIASSNEQLAVTANKVVVAISNKTSMQNIVLCVPLKNEQQQIANFLDHETAKIDTLIEKQQQLIKLLKEKRQAVISHAVTKGLNPNAPMRDSSVEWLGEVPEHWEIVPLKYLCKFSGGGTPSKENLSYWTGGDIPWVSPKDMKSFWVSDTQDKLTEKAVKESSTNFVESGALLMVVRSGILQRTIPIAINTVRVTLNQDMKALRFNSQMNVEYAANFILGYQDSLLLEWSKEGATVESIEHEYLSNSLFPVPPIEEQKMINQAIKERMDVFQSLEDYAVRGIALMQERRTALISAAVTGKIDVRNWQAPEPLYRPKETHKEEAA